MQIPGNKSKSRLRLQSVGKGLALLVRRFPSSVIAITVLSIVTGAVPAVATYAGKRVIDIAVDAVASPDPMLLTRPLVTWLLAAGSLALGTVIARWRQTVAQDWLQRAGAVEVDRMIVDRTQRVDILTRESPEYADRQMLVQMGSGALSAQLISSVVLIGQTLVTVASFAVVLVSFSPGWGFWA